jgi:hypothetical protein
LRVAEKTVHFSEIRDGGGASLLQCRLERGGCVLAGDLFQLRMRAGGPDRERYQ